MIDKGTKFQKLNDGKVLMIGITLQAVNDNQEKVCCNCEGGFGTDGCLPVNQEYMIKDMKSGDIYGSLVVSHTL